MTLTDRSGTRGNWLYGEGMLNGEYGLGNVSLSDRASFRDRSRRSLNDLVCARRIQVRYYQVAYTRTG